LRVEGFFAEFMKMMSVASIQTHVNKNVGETKNLSKLKPSVFDRNRNGIAVRVLTEELFRNLEAIDTRRLNIPK
jgi:hypothetical protein